MKYIAINNKILIKEIPQKEEIITYEPEGSPDKAIRGGVISIGQKVKTVSLKSIVYFLQGHGRRVTLNNEEYWVVEEDKIMVAELGRKNE